MLAGHETVHCPLSFRKIVQMWGLGSAAPKVDFIVIPKGKPGTFETKIAT